MVDATALVSLILCLFVFGCADSTKSADETKVGDLWWNSHMGRLSPDEYVRLDAYPPWAAGLSANQRKILENADSILVMQLREDLPSRDNDFFNSKVVAWQRLTDYSDVRKFSLPLLESIDHVKNMYPDFSYPAYGVRVWSGDLAIDLVISIDERLVHVFDRDQHRYCEIPVNEIGNIKRRLNRSGWKTRPQ